MRYRPFGATGKAVSAISLLLREAPNMTSPSAWRAMVFSAMENGVNCFELAAGIDVLALGMGEALRAVERRLLFLSWRIRGDGHHSFTAQEISNSVRAGLAKTGAGYFDLLMIDEPAYETLAEGAEGFLADLRAAGLCLQIGVAGDGEVIDNAVTSAGFDVLATPFNLTSDWKARRRIREAADRNMTVVAYDPYPNHVLATGRASPMRTQGSGLLRRAAPSPLAGAGTYAFLEETPNWAADEICVAYLLTEPTFSTVQIEAFRPDVIARMAAVSDRDLPTGVAAQIEMARFSADGSRRRNG